MRSLPKAGLAALALIAACGSDNSDDQGPDSVAPTVSITGPAAGAVTGVVTITVDAADDRRIAEVRFTVNGAAVGGQDMTAPYSYAWDTGTYAAGTYEWRAVAEDGGGNITTSMPVTYTIAP